LQSYSLLKDVYRIKKLRSKNVGGVRKEIIAYIGNYDKINQKEGATAVEPYRVINHLFPGKNVLKNLFYFRNGRKTGKFNLFKFVLSSFFF